MSEIYQIFASACGLVGFYGLIVGNYGLENGLYGLFVGHYGPLMFQVWRKRGKFTC